MTDETILEHTHPKTVIGPTTVSFTPLSVSDVNIYEGSYDNGIKHIYNPQEDITNYELALLLKLFVFASATSGYNGVHSYDYWGYVKEHNLERHFT